MVNARHSASCDQHFSLRTLRHFDFFKCKTETSKCFKCKLEKFRFYDVQTSFIYNKKQLVLEDFLGLTCKKIKTVR